MGLRIGIPGLSPLQAYLAKNGRFPGVSLQIQPLDPTRLPIEFTQFDEYNFKNSVLVPVDSFEFKFRNPTFSGSVLDFVRDGDIAILKANGEIISSGIVDAVNISTSVDAGEVVTVHGRNFLAQLEDQSTINDVDDPIWGNKMGPEDVINALILNTRINFFRLQQAPTLPTLPLFGTEPGESKLSALQRYLEPLNMLVWMDPDGTVVLGKPNMADDPLGTFIMDRPNRTSNVLSIQANHSSTRIPNMIIPVWTGQETVQSRVAPEQALANGAQGPKRLLARGHRVPKSIVISNPQGSDPQALAQATQLIISGGSNVLQAYAKREIARANVQEIGVQVNVQGHYNSNLDPFLVDSNYQIVYPRASLNESMYLHTVEYSLSEGGGQKTSMSFCRLGCIVADVANSPSLTNPGKSLVGGIL